MAEYIDRDALFKYYRALANIEWNKTVAPISWCDAYEEIADHIAELPTADVVPKSEYDEKVIERAILGQECEKFKAENEKLQGDLIVWKQDRFNLYQRLELYEITRQKVAREIFEELARKSTYVFPTMLYTIAKRDVDELKNKYTEEKE